MTEKTLVPISPLAVMPVMDLTQAVERRDAIVKLTQRIMVEGIDFGTVPGTNKPTLFKPGAEKLTTFFGLSPRFQIIKEIEDWGNGGREPFLYYWYKCQLWRGDLLVGEGDGSCNSHENRYRWRWVDEADIPPTANPELLKKRGGRISEFVFAIDKGETTGKYGKPEAYWQRFRDAINDGTATKTQRTTAKGAVYDAWEIDSTQYRIPNDDIASLANTILKMAQKRALVAATLIAVNASEFFTQDLEDMVIDGEYEDVPLKPRPPVATDDPPKQRVGLPVDDLVAKGKAAMAEQPTAPDDKPHWIESRQVQRRFWKFAGDIGLDSGAVHSALGVDHVNKFLGTMDEAKELMEAYAKRVTGEF
jgi:hypothetical protein